MSTVTTTPGTTSAPNGAAATSAAPAPRPVDPAHRLTSARIVRSEWVKARTLRSTWVGLAGTLLAIVAFGLVAALSASGSVDAAAGGPPGFAGADPVSTVLSGANFGILIVAVLGVLMGAREYSSGMIRSTLAAVPTRLPVLWAKLLTFLGTFGPVILVGVLVAFFGGTAILTNAGVTSASWGDTGVARAVLGTAAYLLGIGVMGLSFGVLFRSIAGGIGTVIGGILFVPTLASALLPDSWDGVLKYLPSNAGQAFTTVSPSDSLLSPGWAAAVFTAWVVTAVVAAAVAMKRRDV